MVHGVFHREHLPDCCSLPALATAPVMSADGSWVNMNICQIAVPSRFCYYSCQQMVADGVCNHEHLPDIAVLRLRCYSTGVSRWFMEVCTHEHLPGLLLPSLLCAFSAGHVSRWFMECCTHEHLPDRCSLCSALAPALNMSAVLSMECLHS
jgi:hypothetical protein